jgi:hypothetical protein
MDEMDSVYEETRISVWKSEEQIEAEVGKQY